MLSATRCQANSCVQVVNDHHNSSGPTKCFCVYHVEAKFFILGPVFDIYFYQNS